MVLFLTVLSGVAWTVVYVDAIRVGLRARTYAMPVAALALNIAWEAIYSVHGVLSGLSIEGRYVYGLTDLKLSTVSTSTSYQTRSFLVLLGLGF